MKMRAKRKRHNARWLPEPWYYFYDGRQSHFTLACAKSFYDVLMKHPRVLEASKYVPTAKIDPYFALAG